MRILIVEDSPTLADALAASLAREGYACDHAGDGASAAAYIDQYDYDIVVLEDCCCGISTEEHDNAIKGLQRFCRTTTSHDVVFE